MTSAVQISRSVYRALLLAYPRDFRQRFGNEMVTTFSDQLWSEWRRRGHVGAIRVWRSAVNELFSVAVPLQLRSSIVIAMAISFLGASVLFMALLRAVTPQCGK